ncbi:MAG: 16S rRNA (cytidine(1402)-2'-O)-methyltransferase [Clostridiales bacterium]|nr:16S rRNA (cytidine(1402)-2'-O)-methyltransferase [Clostridiales bacterium]
MSGVLYIVGTPIGNLSDMSPRAVQTLTDCDFIAAEDTRVTLKLLNRFGIKKPMISYYEHNRREKGSVIIERLLAGESCALVSDAGMPAISDPGEELVDMCHAYGIGVSAVPGPSAFVTALAISGMPSGRFTFEGFLTQNKPNRIEHLKSVSNEKRTMLFYEAPHKLPSTLRDMLEYFGDRRIALVREITKIYETVERTTLAEAAEKYTCEKPKGEFVIVVEGAADIPEKEYTLDDAINTAKSLMGEMSLNDAAKEAARLTRIKKSDIYKALQEK